MTMNPTRLNWFNRTAARLCVRPVIARLAIVQLATLIVAAVTVADALIANQNENESTKAARDPATLRIPIRDANNSCGCRSTQRIAESFISQ